MPNRPKQAPKVEERSGRYRVRISVHGRRRSYTFDTFEEAQLFAASARIPSRGPDRLLRLGEAVQLLRDDLTASSASDGTRRYYESHLAPALRFWSADLPLLEIGADEIRRYLAHRQGAGGVSANTALKSLLTLRRVFRLALAGGDLTRDPFEGLATTTRTLRGRARSKRYPALTAEQLAEIVRRMRAAPYPRAQRHADFVEFFWHTAMRRSEAARLRVRDVDLFGGWIRVQGKTADDRIPISEALRPVLARLIQGAEPGDRVIATANGISVTFATWQKRLGIPELTPHAIRHGAATHLVRVGVGVFDVQRHLRHARLGQTRRYYHEDVSSRTPCSHALRTVSTVRMPRE